MFPFYSPTSVSIIFFTVARYIFSRDVSKVVKYGVIAGGFIE